MPENTTATTARPRRLSLRRIAWLAAAVIALPLVVKEGDVLFGQNFHTVVPGSVYRSAQLSGYSLESRVCELGIKSVVNLRGPNAGASWYDSEIETSHRLGISHFDVALSARQLPPPARLLELVEVLRNAPRPVLVHCKNGADRSGLASALAMILDSGDSTSSAASRQLSLWYGHVPIGATTAMDRVLVLFTESGTNDSAAWVRDDYPSVYEEENK